MLEEFGPQIEHVEGKNNVVADALSRLEITHKDSDEVATDEEKPQLTYMTVREVQAESFPMSPTLIRKEQEKDKNLQQKVENDKAKRYSKKEVEGVSLVHFEWKIFVPKPLRDRIIGGGTIITLCIRGRLAWKRRFAKSSLGQD